MHSASRGDVAARRTLPSPVLPSPAIPSLVAATSAVAHPQIARITPLQILKDRLRFQPWVHLQQALHFFPDLLKGSSRVRHRGPASIRSALAPAGDTCAPSLRPCPLWPPRFPDSFPLSPRQTTSSPACLSPNCECRQEPKTRAWLLSLIGNSNCRRSGGMIVAHQQGQDSCTDCWTDVSTQHGCVVAVCLCADFGFHGCFQPVIQEFVHCDVETLYTAGQVSFV